MNGSTRPALTPARGRPGALLLTLLLALLPMMSSCSSGKDSDGGKDSAPEPNAWERVMAMTGPNGEVGTEMALTAFATAFGPLPGAAPAPGDPGGIRSGSAALRWITGHWWDITPEQRDAVGAVFGGEGLPGPEPDPPQSAPPGAARATSAAAAPETASCPENTPASVVYAARSRAFWKQMAAKLGMPDPIAIAVCVTSALFTGESGPPRASVPSSGSGWNHPSGPQCKIMLHPLFLAGTFTEAQRNEALVHELAHCFQGILLLDISAYAALPGWVAEGLADWMSGNLTGHYSDAGWWQHYLTRVTPSLKDQSYEAIGFWSELAYRGVDPWSVARSVTVTASPGGVRRDETAFDFALGGRRQDVLEGWPSSFLREQARELAWDTTGVGITPNRYSGGEPVAVTNDKQVKTVAAPPFEPALAALDVRAEVVRLSSASGASLFGRFGPGPNGDYPLSAHIGAVFCTRGSDCKCPKDTPGEGTVFTRIQGGRGYMAVSGGERQAAVGLTGQSLRDFCGEPKRTPSPRPPGGGATGTGPNSSSACLGGGGTAAPADACRTGSSNGDPHLATFDGLRYDFQAAGEFTLAASPDDGLLVQVRQEPYVFGIGVSVNSAVAARVAGDRVVFGVTDAGTVDIQVAGRPVSPAPRTDLPGGGALTRVDGNGTWYELRWPDGTTLFVTPIGSYGLKADMSVPTARTGRLQGLLGNADGDPANDLDAGGGKLLTKPTHGQPPFADLYGPFADRWRLRQADSLFDYAPGESTATFTDRAFPGKPVDPATLPDRPRAEQLCQDAGVTDPELLEGCIIDVAITGRSEFAASVAAQQRFLASAGGQPVPPVPPVPPRGELCHATGPRTFACSGEVTVENPVPGGVFAMEGAVKLSFVPVPGSNCGIEYAVFRLVDAVMLGDFVSVCEPSAVAVDPAPTDYGLVLRAADFLATGPFGLTIVGT